MRGLSVRMKNFNSTMKKTYNYKMIKLTRRVLNLEETIEEYTKALEIAKKELENYMRFGHK